MKIKNITLDFDKNVKFKLFIDLNKITFSLLYRENEESMWAERLRKTYTVIKNHVDDVLDKNIYVQPTLESISEKIIEIYDEFIPLKNIENELMESIKNFSGINIVDSSEKEKK
jgi:hypothetical protein